MLRTDDPRHITIIYAGTETSRVASCSSPTAVAFVLDKVLKYKGVETVNVLFSSTESGDNGIGDDTFWACITPPNGNNNDNNSNPNNNYDEYKDD
mmetsp:Transcript_36018/g.44044  ORF Transcript_36018/g.44044 Transcript_36018/m.44044 type:complete len:95 (-) Transcript_36018:134-418(-)